MPPANLYAKPAATAAAAKEKENEGSLSLTMGPQSQRLLTLNERTHQLQSQSYKKKKVVGQQTLFGDRAFDPLVDCEVCRAKQCGRTVHRAHDKRCWQNRRTRGKSEATMSLELQEKQLRLHFETPLTEAEKCSAQHVTKEAGMAFFAPRKIHAESASSTTTISTTAVESKVETTVVNDVVTAAELCNSVTDMLKDPRHVNYHNGRAPAAMLAFANVVVKKIILNTQIDTSRYFDGLTMTVPANENSADPQCHSIVGHKLLLVDWKRMHGLDVTCPGCRRCNLTNDRTNFSKNKILFPTFGLEGSPQWAMVQTMTCNNCRARCDANSAKVLCNLPAYARATYSTLWKRSVLWTRTVTCQNP